MGCRKMMTEKDVVRLLRSKLTKVAKFMGQAKRRQGIDFRGTNRVWKNDRHSVGASSPAGDDKKLRAWGLECYKLPDNFTPPRRATSHSASSESLGDTSNRERDAVAIVSGDSTKPQEDGCSARGQHFGIHLRNSFTASDTIVKTGRSGSETAVGYVLNLPGVVDLMLKNEQELQMCYEDYASRNKGGEIRYEDLLEFAVRVGFAQSIPNDLSSKFLLLRAFLACKSGNQVGVDLHWKDFDTTH